MSKRGKFSLSNTKLLSCDMGYLVPINTMEVLPGDSIQQSTSALVRTQPLLAPVMHPVHVRIHHWFVPYRLIWDEWEDFITGGPNGTSVPSFPISASTGAVGSLDDYLGLPPALPGLAFSALPRRAYALIFNEWYRDQDLVTPVALSTASGVDSTTNFNLLRCAWEKDYFTSARPFQQKGPAITLPLGNQAPVKGIGFLGTPGTDDPSNSVRESDGTTRNYTYANSTDSPDIRIERKTASSSGFPNIYADLTNASAITVTALRTALAVQRYAEARARYGSRYVEYLRYLGVKSSDARLSRPEYLGGGKQTIQFSEVLQTAQGSDPVGQMRGHGIAAMRSNRYRRYFEEHGIVMSMLSIRPKTIYAQKVDRMWNRRVKEDFWQKELQHIGQQAIKNKEVYGPHSNPEGTFGWQDRFDEYRRAESSVAGEFRTTDLDFWHMARVFTGDPALNSSFVQCVPTERNFPVPSKDVVYVMANHSIQARRLVSQKADSFIY